MSRDILIRSYEPKDRDAIRRISFETGDRGQPVGKFFDDEEIVADFLTLYYTDFEPESCSVAESEGEVVGYLTGCRNNRYHIAKLWWPLLPRIVVVAFLKGLFFRALAWRYLTAAYKNWQIGGFSDQVPRTRECGHFHIDLSEHFRGKGIGKELLERFLMQCRESQLKEVYAVSYEDNAPACKFFERMGFSAISRHPRIVPEGEADRLYYTVVLKKVL